MANEVEWQTRICKSLRAEGGYGHKWASAYLVGVPDIVAALPRIGSFFIEVKLIDGVSRGFNRKIGVTLKQQLELQKMVEAGALAMVGVVSVVATESKPGQAINFTLVPHTLEVLSWDDIGAKYPTCAWLGGAKGFTSIEAAVNNFRRMAR